MDDDDDDDGRKLNYNITVNAMEDKPYRQAGIAIINETKMKSVITNICLYQLLVDGGSAKDSSFNV